ncbi:MAG: hypothetical protein ACXWXV_11570 [Aeromicrobium sp.]
MAIRFTPSAHRHGISADRALYVIENCPLAFYLDPTSTRPDRLLFLWHDLNGAPIEVVAVEEGKGDLLVIHAMRMRRSYESKLLEVGGWLKR